jgi:hypothetical protein
MTMFRCYKHPLYFKGRAGVGMGLVGEEATPIPLLSSPLKGEGRGGGSLPLGGKRNDITWEEVRREMSRRK